MQQSLLRLGRPHDFPVFTLPPHMTLHRLPERSYDRSFRSTVPPSGETNSASPHTYTTLGVPHLPTFRLSHVSTVVKHTPPSSPPTLLDPISSPPPSDSRPTPPSLAPRPSFASVVKTDHYPPNTTILPPIPIFHTWIVVVHIAHSPRVTRLILFSLVPFYNPIFSLTSPPSILSSVLTAYTPTSIPSHPVSDFLSFSPPIPSLSSLANLAPFG